MFRTCGPILILSRVDDCPPPPHRLPRFTFRADIPSVLLNPLPNCRAFRDIPSHPGWILTNRVFHGIPSLPSIDLWRDLACRFARPAAIPSSSTSPLVSLPPSVTITNPARYAFIRSRGISKLRAHFTLAGGHLSEPLQPLMSTIFAKTRLSCEFPCIPHFFFLILYSVYASSRNYTFLRFNSSPIWGCGLM